MEHYITFKSLVAEHGKETAEKLRETKRLKQQLEGDAYPDCPHHMNHPDFGDDEDSQLHPNPVEYIISLLSFQYHVSEAYELFLCFDGAKIAKSHVDQVDSTTRAVLDVNPAQAAPLMLLCWNCFQWS